MSEFDNGFEGAQVGAYQASINRFVEGDKQRVNKSEEIKSQGNGNAGRIEILPESRRAYRRVVVGCGLVLIVGKDILIDRRKIWVLLHWKRPLWLVWAKIPTKDGLFLCLSNIRFYLHSKHEEGKGQTKMSHPKIRDDSCLWFYMPDRSSTKADQPDILSVSMIRSEDLFADSARLHIRVRGTSLVSAKMALTKAREVAAFVSQLQTVG